MKRTVIALAAATIALTTVQGHANTANSSYKKLQKEWSKMDKTGGYGNPLVHVPTAIVDAMGSAFDTVTGAEKIAKDPSKK